MLKNMIRELSVWILALVIGLVLGNLILNYPSDGRVVQAQRHAKEAAEAYAQRGEMVLKYTDGEETVLSSYCSGIISIIMISECSGEADDCIAEVFVIRDEEPFGLGEYTFAFSIEVIATESCKELKCKPKLFFRKDAERTNSFLILLNELYSEFLKTMLDQGTEVKGCFTTYASALKYL